MSHRIVNISRTTFNRLLSPLPALQGDHLIPDEFAAYASDLIPAVDLKRLDAHLEACYACCEKTEQLMDASDAWVDIDATTGVTELMDIEIDISEARPVVLAARLAWDEMRRTLEITMDKVHALVVPDSPFGQGFRLAQPGLAISSFLGQAREEVLASANTEDGDELRILPGIDGEHPKVRFYGEHPPRLIFTSDAGQRREYVWEQIRGGWETNLDEPSMLQGTLTAELD